MDFKAFFRINEKVNQIGIELVELCIWGKNTVFTTLKKFDDFFEIFYFLGRILCVIFQGHQK